MTGFLSAVFWGLLLLSLLVFIHEGGHFLAARLCGMRVTEFFLGLPSRFSLSFTSPGYGTKFGVTPILLGGYTRICGMEGELDPLLQDALAFAQRQGSFTAGDLAAALDIEADHAYALLHTLADWASIAEEPADAKAEVSGIGFTTLARDANLLTKYDRGNNLTDPDATAEGAPRPIDPDQMDAFFSAEKSRTYVGKGFLQRVFCLVAGPLVNLVFAFVVIFSLAHFVGFETAVNSNVLGDVGAGTLAQEAGLQAGDEVTSLAGQEVTDWLTLGDAIDKVLADREDFTVEYVRDGEKITASVAFPTSGEVTEFGVLAQMQTVRLSAAHAARFALSYGQTVANFAARLIMPQHTMEVLQGSSSVVGISAAASKAAASGPNELVSFMAAVSMSLGFMNLLPIPPLDGGKIVIEVVQLAIRRPLSLKAQAYISYVGLAFFLFIFAYAVKNDIASLLF